jgi:hypothetical protein
MSQEQILNFKFIKALLKELKAFGLNPNDWRLERSSKTPNGSFGIQHRKDADFRLIGQCIQRTGGGLAVRGLSVHSF